MTKFKDNFFVRMVGKNLSGLQMKFLKDWHYSETVSSLLTKYIFTLEMYGDLVGIAVFGTPAGRNSQQKYADNKDPNGVLELRRLCCIDDTPKNTESFFIGSCLRWLKKNSDIHTIVSYADPMWGHDGTIYKATNFDYLGFSENNQCKYIYQYNNKIYSNRTRSKKFDPKMPGVEKVLGLPKHVYLRRIK
jgi:hypothetical protein